MLPIFPFNNPVIHPLAVKGLNKCLRLYVTIKLVKEGAALKK